MGLVTVFCPLTTIGTGETELQTAGARFVVDCKVNPAGGVGALVGHDKITFDPAEFIANGGGGNERLNTVPDPALPPAYAVPYRVLPDRTNPAYVL